MPFLDLPITAGDTTAEFRVIYELPGPADEGPAIAGVVCLAIQHAGRPPLPQEAVDAVQDPMCDLFWRHYSPREVADLCEAETGTRVTA